MIYLASDHRGFEMKDKVKKWLIEWGYEHEDMGPFEYDPQDDYTDFCSRVAEKIAADPENSLGLALGHTGQGEAMMANKFKRVRATVYYGGQPEMVKLTKEHNHSNMLCLSATFMQEQELKEAIKLWFETAFTFEERHVRRIKEIESFEDTGRVHHS